MKQASVAVAMTALLIGGMIGYVLGSTHTLQKQRAYDDNEVLPMGMHRMPDGSLMGNPGNRGADAGSYGMMGGGVGHMMDMAVESEQEFLEGMIPHHQEAVDTAKEVIARGGSTPEIKALVETIVVAQEREITDMKAWYEDWYGVPYTDAGTYEPMMRDLSALSGAALDRVFLEDMIGHHMGAIMMAQSVQPHIEHSEIEVLSEAIITTQSAEIADMRQMLQGL